MAEAAQMQVSDEVAIQITGMNKWYGQFHVLRDINMTVQRGERIVICGPSVHAAARAGRSSGATAGLRAVCA